MADPGNPTGAEPAPGTGRSEVRSLPRERFDDLLHALRERGYRIHGPRPRDGAVVFEEIHSAADLPRGLRDEQEPGRYRLLPSGRDHLFDVVSGPGALKPHFFAPREPVVEVVTEEGRLRARPVVPKVERRAFVGVRACDLAALARQDRIFLADRYPDAAYAARREGVFFVAVSCTRAVATCFCTSMGTGPEVGEGADLALVEDARGLLARADTAEGRAVLEDLELELADAARVAAARAAVESCAASMPRRLDPSGLPELLYENLAAARYDDVAERCLSCGSCTQVCPTCFCHDVRDEPDPAGAASTRVRHWGSCFDPDHARIHGADFRPRVRERYRQWLVHKLGSWIDQFGESGCVGCGRCLTWCPVAIDLTAEFGAIRDEAAGGGDP